MDFLKLVRARYSVRQYQNRPVEPEKVEQLLEAAQAAPTAANCQPVRLLVVETPDGRRRLAGAAEAFAAAQLERGFRTLDFYKSLQSPTLLSK